MKRIIPFTIFFLVMWIPPACASYTYEFRHVSVQNGEIEWAVYDVPLLEELNIFIVGEDKELVIYRQDYVPVSPREIVAVQINLIDSETSEIVTDFGEGYEIYETGGWDPLVFDGVGNYWRDDVDGYSQVKILNYTESYELTDIEKLGKYVFFDKISSPQRMACVTCHDPATGGTGSVSGVNLHQVAITGANPHTVGNIKPPTNAYATFIEPFQNCSTGGLGPNNKCGGNFWDGRAEGNETAMYPDGATKHIGEEIFYDNDGNLLDLEGTGVWEYARHFGPGPIRR